MVITTRELHHTADPRDDDSGIVWLAEQCRNNKVRLESLVGQAEKARDPELAAFFRRACAVGQRLASA